MSKYIAIDLDPQGVFAVDGTARGGARIDHAVAWSGADGEPPPALTPETAKRIGEHLRERLKAAGFAHAPALVVIDRDRVILKELRYPAMAPAEEPNVVRFQAMKELSDAPEDVVLDYVPLVNGAAEGERRSMAVAVRKELLTAIQLMCAAANLKLAGVTPRPYAVSAGLGRAFAAGAAPAPESRAEAVAVLTVGPGGGEFTVSRNGEVTFARPLKGPAVATEAMLVAEVRRNLTTYAGSNPGHPIQALYVAEADGRWARRLGIALGVPVHPFDPLAGSVPHVPEHARGRFAGAVGALAAQSAGVLPINFAAPRQPKAEIDPKRNQMALVALVALAVLAAGGAWGYFALDAADKDLNELATRKAELETQFKNLEPDGKRLAAAKDWRGRRVSWLDEWFDAADRFPVAGGFHAVGFVGKTSDPDRKTGKTTNEVKVTVAAAHPAPVNALLVAFEKDNTDPKAKFYPTTGRVDGGPLPNEGGAKSYTVVASVNVRPPAGFSRTPSFSPPNRKNYPPPVGKEKDAEPEKDKEPAAAPDPKKTTPAEVEIDG